MTLPRGAETVERGVQTTNRRKRTTRMAEDIVPIAIHWRRSEKEKLRQRCSVVDPDPFGCEMICMSESRFVIQDCILDPDF
jgi:hypothetical protein